MNKRPNPEMIDEENPEWTKEAFARAVPFSAWPETLRTQLSSLRGRGPQKTLPKERITIRLSPEVVAHFRATGRGWQTRMDEALKEWLKTHP